MKEKNSDYAGALKIIEEGLRNYPNEQRIKEKKSEIEQKYVQNTISSAEKEFKDTGYEAALRIINAGLEVVPNNQQLKNKKSEYEEYAPVPLSEIRVISGDVDEEKENVRDLLGNWYSPTNLYSVNHGWGSYGKSVLYLGKDYSKMTGTITVGRSSAFSDLPTYQSIYIYGSNNGDLDDATLLKSLTILETEEPLTISVDIKGYKYIHFKVGDHSFFYLVNFQFWK